MSMDGFDRQMDFEESLSLYRFFRLRRLASFSLNQKLFLQVMLCSFVFRKAIWRCTSRTRLSFCI